MGPLHGLAFQTNPNSKPPIPAVTILSCDYKVTTTVTIQSLFSCP